ncbi:MAG TPA: tripartite tricarboxylate transporter substrate binding protein [Xanthobacteraceae bacterium]|jgi:tripartite-type tricarboxylate transporter receptor subunit TctC|nr:tripartite tricarboxylate transporter substrate binding protein [Xanthobacteraceae bacterium]
MNLLRRRFLYLAGAAVAAPTLAWSETYPVRPVHMVVGFAAGGGADIMARLIGQGLTERLGQQIVVDNRPGAGTNIATEVVAKAAPDGYTLLLANSPNAINTTLYDNLSFDFTRDIVPVASIGRVPLVMVVNPALPAKTVPEFIAYAKANPGKVNMGSGGNGAPDHMSGELFKAMAGVGILHVPYRGVAPAIADLLGGQVQVIFGTMPAVIALVKSGKLRALAVTTAARSDQLPDVPAIGEFVPGYEASQWYGIGAPKGTPAEAIGRLNRETNAVLADPKMQARLAELGASVLPGSPADFGKLIADETAKWAKVVKLSGAKPD